MEKLYTHEELVQAVLKERKRCMDIAFQAYHDHFKDATSQKNVEFQTKTTFIRSHITFRVADECRCIGNTISGGNALSAAMGETVDDRVREELSELYNSIKTI